MKQFKRSPWGSVQYIEQIIPNEIYFVSTAGHGGYWLSDRAKKIMKKKKMPVQTWYEEDCESLLVIYAFNSLTPFKKYDIEEIKKGISYWFKDITL